MTTPTVVKFDGGTRPDNPGPSAIGYIVETDDWTEGRSISTEALARIPVLRLYDMALNIK